jgi:hypothetical protein
MVDPTEVTWTTKDRRHIRLTDMDDNHLKNTANMLWRNAQRAHRWGYNQIQADAIFSDKDWYCGYDDSYETADDYLDGRYWAMLDEIEKRGIEFKPPHNPLDLTKEYVGSSMASRHNRNDGG